MGPTRLDASQLDGEALSLLRRIGKPIRLPGAYWIISDVFGVIDCEARWVLYRLRDLGRIKIEKGWIYP